MNETSSKQIELNLKTAPSYAAVASVDGDDVDVDDDNVVVVDDVVVLHNDNNNNNNISLKWKDKVKKSFRNIKDRRHHHPLQSSKKQGFKPLSNNDEFDDEISSSSSSNDNNNNDNDNSIKKIKSMTEEQEEEEEENDENKNSPNSIELIDTKNISSSKNINIDEEINKKKETSSSSSSSSSVGIIMGIVCVMFSSFFAMSVIFPFAPFMVHSFYPDKTEEQLGYYVGYLDSAFFLGSCAVSIVWGKLSDHFGRKPVVLAGLIASCMTSVAFGFSVSFAMAIVIRFLWGALDGNIGVVKTMMGEIATSETQARMYSIIGVCGGIGRLFGNMCGGWLSHINLFGSKVDRFQYVLPCLVSGTSFFISFVVVAFLVRETRHSSASSSSSSSSTNKKALEEKKKNQENIPQSLQSVPTQSTCEIMQIRNVWVTTLFYGYISFLGTGLQAVFPLWVLEKKSHNGFGWRESEIGTVFAIVGPCYTLSQLFLFPRYVKWFGYMGTCKINSIIYGILIILTPHLSVFRHLDTNYAIAIVVVNLVFLFVFRVMVFTCTFVMINNADTPAVRATVNGIGQTFGSVGRLVAPAMLCNIYAYCVDHDLPWPFNYCFVFYIQGLLSFGTAAWVHFLLPKDYEKRCENKDGIANQETKSKSTTIKNDIEKKNENEETIEMESEKSKDKS